MDLHACTALGASENAQETAVQLRTRSEEIPALRCAAGDLDELTRMDLS
jgi:hypothetical protein